MNDQRRAEMAARVRAHRGPPPGADDRVLAAIQTRLSGPSSDGVAEGPSTPPPGGGVAYLTKIAVATATLTVGGLVAIRLAAVGVHAWRDTEVRPADTIVAVAPELPVATPEPEPPPPDDAAPLTVAEQARDEAPPKRPRNVRTPTSESSESNMAAELELLRRAHAASSPTAVISILEQHATEFPHGSLADERDALWSIARCEQGQIDDARTRALDLARRRPHSPLLERIAKRCPALAPEIEATVAP